MAGAAKSFEYAVRDRHGALVNGRTSAASEAALAAKLRRQGYTPVSIRRTGVGFNRESTSA